MVVVKVEEGGELVGLMPLAESPGPWRALRPLGVGPSDILQPLARAGHERTVAEEISKALVGLKGQALIDLHQIREDQPLAAAFQAESSSPQASCLILDLPKTYDAYLGTLGKSLRYDARRLERKAGAEDLRVFEPSNDEVPAAMERLFTLHGSRWRRRGMPGAFAGRRIRGFHLDWCSQAARAGMLRLSLLLHEGRPIGAIYAMAVGRTWYFYQAGFAPVTKALSPGTLLVASAIRRAIEEGAATFDFLRGDEPYKRRWKPQRVVANLRLLRTDGSALGRLGLSWNGAGSRVERRLRERLEGRGLV